MTNRTEFERLLDVYGFRCERFGQDLSTHARAQVVSAFAALASAPVADERPLRHALERIADSRNTHFAGDAQVVARAALASAPVAGEAQPVAWFRKTDITEWTDTEPETMAGLRCSTMPRPRPARR